jgi:serine/threonine-protein kinase ATR
MTVDTRHKIYIPYLPQSTMHFGCNPSTIQIQSLHQCVAIQCHVTNIIYHLLIEYSQFTSVPDVSFFMQLCIQLNVGDKKTKKISLRCINQILKHEDSGAIEAFSNKKLIDIIIRMLTFGQDKERIPKFRDEEFDDYLAECIGIINQHSNTSGVSLDSRLVAAVHNSIEWILGSTKSTKMKNTMVTCFKQVLREFWPNAITVLFPHIADASMRDSLVDCFRDLLKNEIVPIRKRKASENDDDEIDDANSDDESTNIDYDSQNSARAAKRRKIDMLRRIDLSLEVDSPTMIERTLSTSCNALFSEFSNRTKAIRELESKVLSDTYVSHFSVIDTLIRSCITNISDVNDNTVLDTVNNMFSAMVECMNCHLTGRIGEKKDDPFVKSVIDLMEEIHKGYGFDRLVPTVMQAFLHFLQTLVELDQYHRVLCIPYIAYFPRSFFVRDRCDKILAQVVGKDEKVRAAAISALATYINYNGPQMVSYILPTLKKAMLDKSTLVQEQLGKSIGQIIRYAFYRDRGKKAFVFSDWADFFSLLDENRPKQARLAFLDSVPFFIKCSCFTDMLPNRASLKKCLDLITDKDTDVRTKFASVIDCLIEGDASPVHIVFSNTNTLETPEKILLLLFNHIKIYVSAARSHENDLSLQSLLITLGHIGAHATGNALITILFFFLEELESASDQKYNLHSIATAYDQIRYIARQQPVRVDTARLFDPFRDRLNDWIYNKLNDKTLLIKMVAEAVFDMNEEGFLREALSSILPRLVKNRHRDKLQQLSKSVKKNVKELIFENMEDILVHLFMEDVMSDEYLKYILADLSEVTIKGVKEIQNLLKIIGLTSKLVNQLTDYDPVKYERVVKALRFIAERLGINNYKYHLNDHFLGVMDVITSSLSAQDKPQSERVKSLICFDNLLRILGSEQRCYTKVMSTLKDIMQDESLRSTACDVWYTFVRYSDSLGLKHHLGQISVILLPYIEKETTKIVKILDVLVIEKRDIFQEKLMDIPFLPNLPALEKINSIISEQVGVMNFSSQISRLLKMTNHESSNVVVMCLSQLKSMLLQNQDEVRSTVLNDETLINELVARLLAGCNDANIEVRLLCAECLGVLGALDPSILSIATKSDIRQMLTEVELTTTLIADYGVKCLKDSHDQKTHDQVCYAIQELLRFCYRMSQPKESIVLDGDRPPSEDSTPLKLTDVERTTWWNNAFTEQQRDTIQPFLGSAYCVRSDHVPKRSVPIYKPKMKQMKWLRIWISELSKRSRGVRTIIFTYAKLIVNTSQAAGMFILPYLVQNVIMTGTDEDREDIKKEIIAVLEHMDPEGSEHAQTIFSLIELLKKWVDQTRLTSETNSKEKKSNLNDLFLTQIKHVEKLIAEIPKDVLARSAMINRAYTRAIKYYEEYLRAQRPTAYPFIRPNMFTQDQVSYLQKIYSTLDEPDGLTGIATLRTSTSLQEQILDDEASGKWIEAMHCYELALQKEPDNMEHHLNLLKCFRHLGHLQTMLRNIDGALTRLRGTNTNISELHTYAVQSAWRLGQWSLVEEFLGRANPADFEFGVASALLAYRKRDKEKFKEIIDETRKELIVPLSAASMESYERSYPYVVQAQMLHELEQSFALWDFITENNTGQHLVENNDKLRKFVNNMEQSLKSSVESLNTREALLSLRRVLYSIHGLKGEVGKSWLSWAKVARKIGHHQTASSAMLQARSDPPPNFYIEHAKLLWEQGQGPQAISIVESSNLSNLGSDPLGDSDVKLIRAKMLLMAVKWNEATRHKNSEDVIKSYVEVIHLEQEWEMGYFHLAKYKDMLFCNANEKVHKDAQNQESSKSTRESQTHINDDRMKQLEPYTTFLPDVLKNYGCALKYGHKNLYIALPRMLTLWFNAGTFMQEQLNTNKLTKGNRAVVSKAMENLNAIMSGHVSSIAPYMWYVSLSQIISRITHENAAVKQIVKRMVNVVLGRFPTQAVWTLCYVLNHTVEERRLEAKTLLDQAYNEDEQIGSVIDDAQRLFTALLALCKDGKPEKCSNLSLSTQKYFRSVFNNPPRHTIVPLQKAFNITLPHRKAKKGVLDPNYDPFPNQEILIEKFEDKVIVMSSMMKPKKMGITANDGQVYSFLAKIDDLRKDNRMMEFNSMLNRLFKKTPDSRRRKLYIRTFAAVPLDPDCGLVEWVNNTQLYRNAIKESYAALHKKEITHGQIRELYSSNDNTSAHNFKTKVLAKFEPVFHAWFSQTFPEPTKWFASRLNYARTLAVMSMVGYVVGLGDRHSENILLDCYNGDIIHVDLSMLFERGRTLKIPEMVPFRLTHNMIDALGVTGYEGVFRNVCEVAMSVLRANKDALLNVLETFVHDPLVEWNKQKKSQVSRNVARNEHASTNPFLTLKQISNKLQGQMEDGLPLSVQGQVDTLISMATSNENLSAMYCWWMSYL